MPSNDAECAHCGESVAKSDAVPGPAGHAAHEACETEHDATVATNDRLTWPRRVENDQPIVGYHCRNCDHGTDHPADD